MLHQHIYKNNTPTARTVTKIYEDNRRNLLLQQSKTRVNQELKNMHHIRKLRNFCAGLVSLWMLTVSAWVGIVVYTS